jgi:hypothetical protein
MDDSPLCERTDWKLPWEGRCRCGEVRIAISAPPLLTAACHCTGCQTMSASAFSLSVAVPRDGFEVRRGEAVVGGLHGATRHYFCPHCLSWMFTSPEGHDAIVNVRASILDDHGWFVPFVEFWTREKYAWAQTVAVHSFETVPAPEEFPALLEQFAARGICLPG